MKLQKISVLGDVMTEPPFMEGIRQPDGSYDYYSALLPLKGLLSEADLVLANLETPVAGEDLLYSQTILSFNAPESLPLALKKIGVDAVSTANNHALDRGGEGLVRTLSALDRIGLPHTGTYSDPGETERNLYLTVGGIRVAVVAYTYGTNARPDDAGAEEGQINYLMRPGDRRPAPVPEIYTKTEEFIREVTGHKVDFAEKARLKKILGVPVAYADDYYAEGTLTCLLPRLRRDLEEAKKRADLVLFLPHSGGQFNTEPGAISEFFLAEAVKMGFDAVYCAHSHTTQKAVLAGGVPVFYSLGNVTMSSRTPYSQHETLPMYGLCAHLYLDGSRPVRSAYSVFRIVEEQGAPMRVVPADEYYAALADPAEKAKTIEEIAAVTKRVSGFFAEGEAVVRREYELS